MRLLGPKSSLPVFRWDLIYLYAGLNADERAAIKDLAPSVLALVNLVQGERDTVEEAENLLVVAYALRTRGDKRVDATTLAIGGVARAVHKPVYAILFPTSNPTEVTKMALDKQLQENKRIAKELGALPADHELRVQYHVGFVTDIAALEKADDDVEAAELSLAFARSKARQLKLQIDKDRLSIYAKLIQILGDKKAADAFFRPSTTTPGGDEADEAPAEEEPGKEPKPT